MANNDVYTIFHDAGHGSVPYPASWLPFWTRTFSDACALTELPPLETLPAELQSFIAETRDMPVLHRLDTARDFSRAYITYSDAKDQTLNFEAILANPVGDCDDHAVLTAGLLRYMGIPPEDILFVTGNVACDIEGQPLDTKPSSHAFLVVRHEDDFYYVDNLAQTPARLDETMQIDGVNINPKTGEPYGFSIFIGDVELTMKSNDPGSLRQYFNVLQTTNTPAAHIPVDVFGVAAYGLGASLIYAAFDKKINNGIRRLLGKPPKKKHRPLLYEVLKDTDLTIDRN